MVGVDAIAWVPSRLLQGEPVLTADQVQVRADDVSPPRVQLLNVDITVPLTLVDAEDNDDVGDAMRAASPEVGLGAIVGRIPLEWRATLRQHEISFLTTDGVWELFWPGARGSRSHLRPTPQRRHPALSLRGAAALIVQALLDDTATDQPSTVEDLADRSGYSYAHTARVLRRLAAQGLAVRDRDDELHYRPADDSALLRMLIAQRPWPPRATHSAFLYAPRGALDHFAAAGDPFNVADRPGAVGLGWALTGAVAAQAYGVKATRPPAVTRMWVSDVGERLTDALVSLGLEPVEDAAEANVAVARDRDGLALLGAGRISTPEGTVPVVSVTRAVVDLHAVDLRGDALAEQLWNLRHEVVS